MNHLFEPPEPRLNSYGLPKIEKQPSEDEIFHSFIDSINNAIGNHASYNLDSEDDRTKFIDDYLEEFVFCMHNDSEFRIMLLEVPSEFTIVRKNKEFFYKLNNLPKEFSVSETNKKDAQKIYKNPQNGVACIYEYCPTGYTESIRLINFAYSDKPEEKEISLYKKVIGDFIELKEIKSLEDMRRIIIASYKVYKNSNSGEQ